jgi:hypothetical protein
MSISLGEFLSFLTSCLWAWVWPCNPCFIPNLSVSRKWVKFSTAFLFFFWNWVSSDHKFCRTLFWHEDLLKSNRSSTQGNANAKTGGETPVRVEDPLFVSCALFSSWLLISSPVLAKLEPNSLSLGYFTQTLFINTIFVEFFLTKCCVLFMNPWEFFCCDKRESFCSTQDFWTKQFCLKIHVIDLLCD